VSPKKYYTFMIDPDLAKALKAAKRRDGMPEGEQIPKSLMGWFLRRKSTEAKRRRADTSQCQ
jgi:hypothetical protein